jgi:alkylation response protein AidB-like acyl-CoA dehydrogenase
VDHPGPGLDAEAEHFRTEVCAWLTAEMAPDRTASQADPTDRTGIDLVFEKRLQAQAGQRGWLGISLPTDIGGGGRPASSAAALAFEAAYHDAPLVDTALVLAGAPLIAFGSDEQRAQWLPRMLSGDVLMCIAYTEPDAGNDLAGLTTTAIPGPDGGYVLNGRKTLITGAGKADACLTVARTDLDAPVRRGISMFLTELDRPGISVVPRRTMADYDLWDVVFESAWVPADALLGEQNAGWRQLAYSVEQERTGMYSLGWCQRLFDELRTHCLTPGPDVAPIDDPRVSDRLADLWVALQDGRRAALRLTREEVEERRSAASASAAKVMLTEYAPRLAQAATELVGPAGSITGTLFAEAQEGAPARGRFAYEFLFRFDGPISVGANEIHRGGIAAALGLHRGGNRTLLDALRADTQMRQTVQQVLARENRAASDDEPGYDPDVWAGMLREVWPRVASTQDVRVVLDEIGRARCPLPIHAGLIQPVAALSAVGATEHIRALLSGTRYAMGLHDSAGRAGPQHVSVEAQPAPDGGWCLSGDVRHVSFAADVERFLIAARGESGVLLLVVVPSNAPGLRRQTHRTISADRLTDLSLENLSVPADGVLFYNASAAVEAAVTAGRAAYTAELGGMAAALLDLAVARVSSRQAYGAPIGSLQAVQQRVADIYLDTVTAHDAALDAADAVSTRDAVAVAAAKLSATAAALRVAAGAHQVCGGWGHLADSGLHKYTRAIKAAESQLGTPLLLREIISNALRIGPR